MKRKENAVKEKKGLYIYNINNDISQRELVILSCIINITKSSNKRFYKKETNCYLTNSQIKDKTGLKYASIRQALSSLKEKGLITIEKEIVTFDDKAISVSDDPDVIIIRDEGEFTNEDYKKEMRIIKTTNKINYGTSRLKGFMIPENILKDNTLSLSEKLIFSYLLISTATKTDCKSSTKLIMYLCKIKSSKTIYRTINKFEKLNLVNVSYEDHQHNRTIKVDEKKMTIFIENSEVRANIKNIEQVNADTINIDNVEKVNTIKTNKIDRPLIVLGHTFDENILSKLPKKDLLNICEKYKKDLELIKKLYDLAIE